MRFGFDDACLAHSTGPLHLETTDRIEAVLDELADWAEATVHATEPASFETVGAVHDPDYVTDLVEFCAAGGGRWSPDTVACEATVDAALASAGTACWAVDRALDGPSDGPPFGLCRPPGHHALADDAMGFCFFNNAAVAAERALDRPGVDRVAVVDWDVHHGNGTADCFRGRPDVLYASVHERGLFPRTGDVAGTADDGAGTTLDLPLPGTAGDPEYLAAVREVVRPHLEAFDPDLLVVCAGFDAHERDHTSDASVTTAGYARLATLLRDAAERAGAGLAFVLEGGYQAEALAESVRAVGEAVARAGPPDAEGSEDFERPPDPEVVSLLDAVARGTVEA